LSHRLCSKQTNSKLLSVSPNSKSINIFFIFLFLHFNVQGLKLTIEQKPNIVEKLFFYSISFIHQFYLLTLKWFNHNYISYPLELNKSETKRNKNYEIYSIFFPDEEGDEDEDEDEGPPHRISDSLNPRNTESESSSPTSSATASSTTENSQERFGDLLPGNW